MSVRDIMNRFEQKSPLTVQTRVLLAHALSADKLNAAFHRAATTQYQQELLFSTTVSVMLDLVLQTRTSVHAAFKARRAEIPVSATALYEKLKLTEIATSEELVRLSFQQTKPIIVSMGALISSWVPGCVVKVIDGNCLATTEHRLDVLRTTSAGALPGKGLVVYHPALDLIEDTILCEDGHAQERSLFPEWLARVKAGEVWIGDRNFCTTGALFGLHDKGARFVIRDHAVNAPWEEAGTRQELGRVDTGMVYEQSIRLLDGPGGRKLLARRVTLVLDVATRDGEAEIHVLTDLTRQELGGQEVASVYRKRWTLEAAFLHLTMDLRSEINTLGYPPAALLGLAVGMVAYNLVSTMKASIRAEHGGEVWKNLSGYTMSHEIASTYQGMMVALPAEEWTQMGEWEPEQVGQYLRELARHVDLVRFKKAVRGPKKPPPPRTEFPDKKHVSTARLLLAKKTRTKAP